MYYQQKKCLLDPSKAPFSSPSNRPSRDARDPHLHQRISCVFAVGPAPHAATFPLELPCGPRSSAFAFHDTRGHVWRVWLRNVKALKAVKNTVETSEKPVKNTVQALKTNEKPGSLRTSGDFWRCQLDGLGLLKG